jgi:hypothetical protein
MSDSSENNSSSSHGTMSHTDTNVPAAIPYGVKLNGVNYSLWSQVVETFVAGRGKSGYLTGKIPEPSANDASYDKWSMEKCR